MSYRPGQCNIGRQERRRRAAGAVAGFLAAAALVAACLTGVLPRTLLAGAFVPLAIAFECAVQAYDSFCVGLAALGRFDFAGERDGTRGSVADPGDRRADRMHALKISVVSVVLAALTTAAVVVVA